MTDAKIMPEGDRALLVSFGSEIREETNRKVMKLCEQIGKEKIPGVTECVPAFCSLLVLYDPKICRYAEVKERIQVLLPGAEKTGTGTAPEKKIIHHIPVCYGGMYGEDLASMEKITGLSSEEIIRIHTADTYRIYMLGFLPGFVYLGGLDRRICAPRLDVPRTSIPAGSVGIGGSQTGVYPIASPGGWRLLGWTPVRFYDPDREKPILCSAGEYIRFERMTEAEYQAVEKDVAAGTYREEVSAS